MFKLALCLSLTFTFMIDNNVFAQDWLDEVEQYSLKNGTRLILRVNRNLPIVAIQTWVKVGSLNETEVNNGISHYLEHMLFKGTTTRTKGQIAQAIESRGGNINAATSKEYTFYHVELPAASCDTGLEIIADVIQNATFPVEEIERERTVILEEIKRRDDEPDVRIWDTFNENLFTETVYRYRVIGTSTTVSALNQEMLLEHYHRFYTAENLTVVVVGDFDKNSVRNKIELLYSKIKPGQKYDLPNLSEPEKKPFTLATPENVEQVYFVAGILGPGIENTDHYIFDILTVILGEGRSSRLYRKLREETKLVYAIDVEYVTQKGNGMFVIAFRTSPDKYERAYSEITRELNELAKTGPTEKELTRVRNIVKANWILSHETYVSQAGILGYIATLRDLDYLRNYLPQILKVTAQDVRTVVQKYLISRPLNTVIYIPK